MQAVQITAPAIGGGHALVGWFAGGPPCPDFPSDISRGRQRRGLFRTCSAPAWIGLGFRQLGTSPMPPREPHLSPPKTFGINSSRDMLEKLKREIERLAGSITRQEVVDHGLNAAMIAWHLTDWAWKEIKDSPPRLPSLTTKGGRPIRELKQFQEFVKRNCADLAYCEGIAVATRHFGFTKLPVFSTKVAERFKISPHPIGKNGGAKLHQFSPTGESVSYTAQASELWIIDGDSPTPAAEILENALRWWGKFIDETLIS